MTDLLDKLSALEAKGGDIRDKADPKEVGLEKPTATITLDLEETKKSKVDGETKETKESRKLVYELGGGPKDKGKAFVRLDGWPRVNEVADDVLKLAERDAVAYRGRKLLDVASVEIGSIQVIHGKDEFAFEQNGSWTQTKPADVKIEASKVDMLAADLSRLETTDYVTATPKAEDLDKVYGLTAPDREADARLHRRQEAGPDMTIGKPRPFKDDYYARLDDGPVLLLKKEIVESLDKDASSYRPAQAWQVAVDSVVELRIVAEKESYTLKKKDAGWQVSGRSTLTRKGAIEPILEDLARLKSEKYVTVAPKEGFGFEKPYLQATVVSRTPAKTEPKAEAKDEPKKDDKKDEKKDEAKETTQTLVVGKLDDTGKARYAKVGDNVFLVGAQALAAVDHSPLSLLDDSLLDIDSAAITNFRFTGDKTFSLAREKDEWKVDRPEPFVAEKPAVADLLKIWPKMSAVKIVAYGPKIDWAEFGLDHPKETVAVSSVDKDKKAVEHTVALGKTLKDERFARVDQQQAVVVLDANAVKELTRGPLDFLDTRLLKFPLDAVAGIDRSMKDGDVELTKKDDGWQLVKPGNQPADAPTADDILEKTYKLEAKRIVAYKAKDLAPFGLDKPAATVTIKMTDGKKHVLAVGSADKDHPDERYVRVDDGDRVGVVGRCRSISWPRALLRRPQPGRLRLRGPDRSRTRLAEARLRRDRRRTGGRRSGEGAQVEESLAEFLKTLLLRLRADEIVAGKDADTKTWPRPSRGRVEGARRRADDARPPRRRRRKGTRGRAGPRHYAKLAKGDQVFLLSPALSKEALAEYRSRKPWEPSVDAAQVDQLTITGSTGPLTLTKRGSDWKIVGQPDPSRRTR